VKMNLESKILSKIILSGVVTAMATSWLACSLISKSDRSDIVSRKGITSNSNKQKDKTEMNEGNGSDIKNTNSQSVASNANASGATGFDQLKKRDASVVSSGESATDSKVAAPQERRGTDPIVTPQEPVDHEQRMKDANPRRPDVPIGEVRKDVPPSTSVLTNPITKKATSSKPKKKRIRRGSN
jgi:hypothetical protein